jgi:SAM-dependent methyltransferase
MPIQIPKLPRRFLSALLVAVSTLLPTTQFLIRAETQAAEPAQVYVRVSEVANLSSYLQSAKRTPNAFALIQRAVFNDGPANRVKITAYEENASFVYAVASLPGRKNSDGSAGESPWVRRYIALSPSLFLVEDDTPKPLPSGVGVGGLASATAPRISGRVTEIDSPAGKITSEILYPAKSAYNVKRNPAGNDSGDFTVEAVGRGANETRLLQVVRVIGSSTPKVAPRYELRTMSDEWKFTATIGDKTFSLTLPPPSKNAGTIAISNAGGNVLISNRPFPSGILPHGPEGAGLLDVWDSLYRRPEPAQWDIGRPADELQKVISSGRIAPCRVVDMCCGSGTDAIYLASKGFDVTAIDVAPTALGLAMAKARKANVSVHWIVADILAPPEQKPFDLLYDRGCYHVVRDQNLTAYLETVRKYSRSGSQFLLLATRRDERPGNENPGVSEEELRFDFLSLFDVEWLRQIVLESTRPESSPPGWSALMKRNSAP